MKRYIIGLIGLVMLGIVVAPKIVQSQLSGDCPALIQTALQRVERICTGTGRNQVCYANSWTEAQPQPFITDFSFELGDITELMNIRNLRLGGLNTETDEWGMVLMRLQANVPASLPGQNVLFLLFGEVQLDDRYEMTDSSPMQAIRLRTGVGGPGCSEAPPSGLLVQTPHGVGRVLLQINGVDVSLGSTVFFTAQANGFMTVSTLEGSALVHADGGWSAALPGTQVRVPMSADLEPAGPPSLPQPYTYLNMLLLPVTPLARPVQAAPAMDPPSLQLLQQQILGGGVTSIAPFNAISLNLTVPSLDFLTSPLLGGVSGILNSTTGTVTNVVGSTMNTVNSTVDSVNSTLDGAQALTGALLPAQVAQPVNHVVDTAQTTIDTVADTTTETVNTVTETVTETVNTTTETVTEVVNTTTETVTETVNTVVEETGDTVEDVVDTVGCLLPLLGC